jgi:uncharacterized membrane protein YhaH (DUF805 family)
MDKTAAMDVAYVLFGLNGRIGPRRFGRGLILLTGAMVVLLALGFLVSPGFHALQTALVYPYICLFGKRLHDAGRSAFLWLAFVAGYLVVTVIATSLLMPLLSPAAYAVSAEYQAMMTAGASMAEVFEKMQARAPEMNRLSIMTTLAAHLIATAATGLIAFRLTSQPGQNRHGLPTDDGPFR